MAVPARILELVDLFHADLESYLSPLYNETQTRQEFIDPLFEALGWDIGNKRGAAAAFREVMLEYSMKIGATTKAPDYLFRTPSDLKFFVEAKKPSVNLKDNAAPAYQVRRYAWTAKLPLSVLTDFHEFVIYDTRVEPSKDDKATTARHLYIPYTEYAERWDSIAALFHRDAVLAGSLDSFAQAVKAPKGSLPVDRAFLAEIDGWRDLLAKNIYLWNHKDHNLSTRDLNYAVQMTLDRIIFLRIAEDRGIEVYGRLQELLKDGRVYARLLDLFQQADNRYNSGLFHFSDERGRSEDPDTLTPKLYMDDEVLQKVIRGLYYPDSPYEFSVLPVEVLGNVYEQFLGKVITIGAKDQKVAVEEKPEVRKAGGVYYTPQYIVDYIVANTVGKLLEGKTPKQAEKLRVLDPACGSGSFLIGAYQFLLNWYVQQYVADGPQKYKKLIYQAPSGEWQLTTAERKRILLNNIFGVDLDSQAVEVTKLSLCLKMLEGESAQSLAFQQTFIQERVLPDLSANIKCGNSLIGPDFYEMEEATGLSEDDLYAINAFDWQAEFPAVMQAGGFDAVIGNPPYVRPHNLDPVVKSYFWAHFSTFVKKSDLYCCFIEQSISFLKKSGEFGFIVSNSWLRLDSFEALRLFILKETSVRRIIDFTGNVFPAAAVKTAIILLSKGVNEFHIVEVATTEVTEQIRDLELRHIPQIKFQQSYKSIFDISIDVRLEDIKQKMSRYSRVLGSLFSLAFGLKTGDDSKFLTYSPQGEDHKMLLRGEDIARYKAVHKGEFVWYVPHLMTEHRRTARPGNAERFEQPKVLVRDTGDGLQGTFDGERFYVKDVLVILDKEQDVGRLKYLTGLLNSSLMRFYYETSFPTLHVQRDELASLPIRPINFAESADKARHDQMVQLVEKMLDLNKRLPATKTAQEKTVIQRQIEATDRQIDKLVYELYELTDAEIAIVEEATKR